MPAREPDADGRRARADGAASRSRTPRTRRGCATASAPRPRTRSRCCSSASCAAARRRRRQLPAQAVLGAPALAGATPRAPPRRIADVRRGPRAARLGGQGQPTASSRRSSSARTRGTSPAGRAPRAARRTRSRRSRCASASLAAAAFATGERWGLVAGAVLLQVAFTTDCVDGQLARYTRQFSKLGAWLDSVFDRGEGVPRVRRPGDRREPRRRPGVAARVRGAHAADRPAHVRLLVRAAAARGDRRHAASTPIEQPLDARGRRRSRGRRGGRRGRRRRGRGRRAAAGARSPSRVLGRLARSSTARPRCRWVKRMIAFPIGERFAAISITAALFTPRVDVHRPAGLGRPRRRVHPGRPRAARRSDERRRCAGGGRAGRPDRRLPRRRAARARARPLRSRRCALPAPALLGSPALLPLLVVGRDRRRRRSRRAAAAVLAWPCCSAAPRAARPARPKAAGPSRRCCALTEYVGADLDRRARRPRRLPGRLRAARPRSPSATTTSSTGCATAASTPRALGERAVRRLGRAARARVRAAASPARCRPGYFVAAVVLGAAFVGEAVVRLGGGRPRASGRSSTRTRRTRAQ